MRRGRLSAACVQKGKCIEDSVVRWKSQQNAKGRAAHPSKRTTQTAVNANVPTANRPSAVELRKHNALVLGRSLCKASWLPLIKNNYPASWIIILIRGTLLCFLVSAQCAPLKCLAVGWIIILDQGNIVIGTPK